MKSYYEMFEEDEQFIKYKNIMKYKLNKVKLNKWIGDYLDNGKVEMLVMNEIEDLLET